MASTRAPRYQIQAASVKVIREKGIKYSVLAERCGISYQRLMRIFHQNAAIRGSELLALCRQDVYKRQAQKGLGEAEFFL